MKKTIKPTGERIAVVAVDEAYEGRIVLPEVRNRAHIHGRCIATGDGRYPDGTTKPIFVKVGEVYLYQLDSTQQVNSLFKVDGQVVLLLHQADMICRLNAKAVTFESIDMIGHWVLVEVYYDTPGVIIVPDQVKPAQTDLQHFKIVKQGSEVNLGTKVGDEVFPARGRLTNLSLDGKVYCFIQDNFIYGHVEAAGE